MSSKINAISTGVGGLATSADASGILELQTNDTTAITIDGSQNVSFTGTITGDGSGLTGLGGGFPSGTRMAFQQTSAPTGWTKDTTAAINDSVLRLVTGTPSSGGSTAFSTFNASTATGATTLSTAQMPSHTHNISGLVRSWGGAAPGYLTGNGANAVSGATGGGGSHTHSLATNIKYYDFIIASKD